MREKEREKTKRKTNVASAVLGYAAPLKLVPRQFTCRAAAAAAALYATPLHSHFRMGVNLVDMQQASLYPVASPSPTLSHL